jgi:8-oxo-dGTP pyrophosphatase MutT (NUDIX family)
VLLGRRSAKARFMPGYYVFPGGRLDPADRQRSGFDEMLGRPLPGVHGQDRHQLLALARAALRETYEETGLLVGWPGRPRTRPTRQDVWQAFAAAGMTPGFSGLRLIVRAVTPARSPVRFNTRFFLAAGEHAAGLLRSNGELEEIAWRACSEALRLPLADVTELVLRQALAHRSRPSVRPRRAPLYFRVGFKHPGRFVFHA